MKITQFIGVSLIASITAATYQCPISMSSDTAVVEFAYSIQNFLYKYYQSVSINATFFHELPTGSMVSPFNNQTLAANAVTNLLGLQNQAMLGTDSLADLGNMTPNWAFPSCSYTFPTVTNASTHIANAFLIEATLCGAFIGLADYVQSPTAAFLMARLAADHGTHAAFLRTYTLSTLFFATSVSLVPAFTPENITTVGSNVGNLGQYLGSCVPLPSAPCGGTVAVGGLNAALINATATTPVTACQSMAATTPALNATKTMPGGANITTSVLPLKFTGAAIRKRSFSWNWAKRVAIVVILV